MNLSLTNITNKVVVNHKNSSSDKKIRLLLRKLCFMEKEIQNIEKRIRGYSDSNAWKEHCKRRQTTSKDHKHYSKIKTTSKVRSSTHPKTTPLVCSIIFPDDKLRNLELVKWGRDSKGNALKAFYAKKGVKHIELKLEKAGLFLDKNRTYIGASPDGIIYCKCHGKSIMQVKCLYNIGNSFIKEDIDKYAFLQWITVRFPAIKDTNITHMLFHKYNSLNQIKDIL